VLVPRPETETLVQVVLDRLGGAPPGDIVDLGTGSGCIAVTLAAEQSARRVIATDVSGSALAVTAANALRHGVADRVRASAGDWGEALDCAVAVAVSNPPYVTSAELAALPRDVSDFEPHLALDGGPDGLVAYRSLLASLRGKLLPGALLALEVDPRRSDAVVDLVGAHFPGAQLAVIADFAHAPRVVVGHVASGPLE
jgi:release factor glutamine methyltransferase